ncbi:hypothetical protein C450_00807 [Halococcus salifodinae DSM 8989]|uniref:Uncharacterized protein n=1 Tax=Halococcus salifodinae DSM 8989 TaxID=1227456 RepID=M0ND05_9EURY|nr:hypothetical protein C450_00807 [Halococcus salifodinae DSM 8989]
MGILTGIGIACCLIVTGVGSAPAESARAITLEANTETDSSSASKPTLQQLQQSPPTAGGTDLHINISANGSAVWTLQYRFQLSDSNETAAFDQLSGNTSENPTEYQARFEQRISQALTTAENATGREMAISNVTVRATRNGTTGVVTYEFVWQNFAATDGTRLDIENSLAGLSLDNETQLTMSWPTSYEPVTVRPAPTERQANVVVWDGTTEFAEREPIVELALANSMANTTAAQADGGSSGEPAPGSNLPLSSISLIALVVVVGGLGVWMVRRREHDDTPLIPTDTAEDSETDHGTTSEEAVATPNGGTQDSPASETDNRSLELLSNEEQVIEVLRRSDGRAKQQQIVSELGWTDAKTSSVVSRLRDDGTIEGFRLGRENVLRLPDEATEDTTDDPRTDE